MCVERETVMSMQYGLANMAVAPMLECNLCCCFSPLFLSVRALMPVLVRASAN